MRYFRCAGGGEERKAAMICRGLNRCPTAVPAAWSGLECGGRPSPEAAGPARPGLARQAAIL